MHQEIINIIRTNPVAHAIHENSELHQLDYERFLENLVVALSEQVVMVQTAHKEYVMNHPGYHVQP